MKAYEAMEVEFHSLTSELDEREWPASGPSHVIPEKEPPESSNYESQWVAGKVWHLRRRQKPLGHIGNRNTALSCPTRSPVAVIN
jgi:hypothetical protein